MMRKRDWFFSAVFCALLVWHGVPAAAQFVGYFTANMPIIGGGSAGGVKEGTRQGNTTKFVTQGAGTPGANECPKYDAGGNIISTGVDCNPVAAPASLTATNQTLSGGANVTSLSLSAGSKTINCGSGPLQFTANNGAFTLTAPANDGSCILLVTNGASAGAITFSGFSVSASAGALLNTTNGNKFSIQIWRINGTSGYAVVAHQ